MKQKKSIYFFFALLVFCACKKNVDNLSQVIKKPPVANAGLDLYYLHPPNDIKLHGYGTDADGFIMYYSWRKISGPSSFLITNPNEASTQVLNLDYGVYVFEFKVTDNDGLYGTSKKIVTIDSTAIDPCFGCWDY